MSSPPCSGLLFVLGSMYASGPVGRMGADEAVRLITNRERRRREQEQVPS